MIDRYTTMKKIHMKIFISDVSAYNTHPDFRPDFRRKKCVLYAENYGMYFPILLLTNINYMNVNNNWNI